MRLLLRLAVTAISPKFVSDYINALLTQDNRVIITQDNKFIQRQDE